MASMCRREEYMKLLKKAFTLRNCSPGLLFGGGSRRVWRLKEHVLLDAHKESVSGSNLDGWLDVQVSTRDLLTQLSDLSTDRSPELLPKALGPQNGVVLPLADLQTGRE